MLNFSGDVFKIINEKRGQTRSSSGGGQITRLYQNLCTIPELYHKKNPDRGGQTARLYKIHVQFQNHTKNLLKQTVIGTLGYVISIFIQGEPYIFQKCHISCDR